MFTLFYIAFSFLLSFDFVFAASWNSCATKTTRHSWYCRAANLAISALNLLRSNLTDTEKAAYIDAELCLMSRPSQGGIEGAVNRWDDIHWIHISQASYVHDVGAFLPWHRYYIRVHEFLLQSECDYAGGIPYWNEALDVEDMSAASVFDPGNGFGGNGGADNCVQDGPFADLRLHFNQTATGIDVCLKRSFNANTFALLATQDEVSACLALGSFEEACFCYEGSPHNSGHAGVGGTMLDVRASSGDPIFFLHHSNLDRLWWEWQQVDLDARLTDISGRNIPTQAYLDRNSLAYPSDSFTDYSGDHGNVTTLDHVLWMAGVMPNATISEVMDLGGDLICAEYA